MLRRCRVFDCPMPVTGELSVWAGNAADRTQVFVLCTTHYVMCLEAITNALEGVRERATSSG